jgi:hypothetical protein
MVKVTISQNHIPSFLSIFSVFSISPLSETDLPTRDHGKLNNCIDNNDQPYTGVQKIEDQKEKSLSKSGEMEKLEKMDKILVPFL